MQFQVQCARAATVWRKIRVFGQQQWNWLLSVRRMLFNSFPIPSHECLEFSGNNNAEMRKWTNAYGNERMHVEDSNRYEATDEHIVLGAGAMPIVYISDSTEIVTEIGVSWGGPLNSPEHLVHAGFSKYYLLVSWAIVFSLRILNGNWFSVNTKSTWDFNCFNASPRTQLLSNDLFTRIFFYFLITVSVLWVR